MKSFNFKSRTWILFVAALCALGTVGMFAGHSLPGYQIVQNRVVVSGGATQTVHVDCPSGKKVLGGGFSIETPDDVKIFSSDPSDGHGNLIDHGWSVMVHNTGTQGRQTTAVAICAQ